MHVAKAIGFVVSLQGEEKFQISERVSIEIVEETMFKGERRKLNPYKKTTKNEFS